MTSAKCLEVTSSSSDACSGFKKQRLQSIVNLDEFKLPSPLPASQGLLSGKQNVKDELAKLIQTDGTKVAIYSYVATNYST